MNILTDIFFEQYKNVFDDLKCEVCLNLMLDPVMYSCGHTSCFQCSKRIKTCHVCRDEIHFIVKNTKLKNIIASLAFTCLCGSKTSLNTYSHIKKCSFFRNKICLRCDDIFFCDSSCTDVHEYLNLVNELTLNFISLNKCSKLKIFRYLQRIETILKSSQ